MNDSIFPYECVLETAGYKVTFYFLNFTHDDLLNEDIVSTTIEMHVESARSDYQLSLVKVSISIDTLKNIDNYLRAHIHNVHDDPTSVGPVLVNPGLDFQLQGLPGEVWEENGKFGGGCALRVTLDAGEGSDGTNVYLGAEAQLSLQQVRAFLARLKEFLDAVAVG